MSEQLKPCPFCGGENLKITGFSFVIELRVQCDDCGCCTDFYEIEMDTDETKEMLMERVAKIWNTRTQDPYKMIAEGLERLPECFKHQVFEETNLYFPEVEEVLEAILAICKEQGE